MSATDNRLKIAILIRALDIGGAERQVVYLARGLQALGHCVTVMVFYGGGKLEHHLAGSGVEIVDLAKRGRWDVVRFVSRLVRAVRARRPDTVYTFLSGANVLAGLLKSLFPPLRMIWGLRASNMDLSHYGWLSPLLFKLESRLARRAELIIANSRAGADHARRAGFPSERITVIENGIDTELFRPDQALRTSTRVAWGFEPGDRVVGLLARIDPMKGHEVFLRAAAALAQEDPRVRFVCLGEGDKAYRDRLVAQTHTLGLTDRVCWNGPAHDAAAALNGLDVLCSASLFGEGFSNALCEALACGIPCVATDVGDAARIVRDPRRLVPPDDSEALAGALRMSLDEPRDPEWRADIVKNYSIERMVARTAVLLA